MYWCVSGFNAFLNRSSARTNFEIKPNIDPNSLPRSFKHRVKSINIVVNVTQNRGRRPGNMAMAFIKSMTQVGSGFHIHYSIRSVNRSSARTNFEIKPNIDPNSFPRSFKILRKSVNIVAFMTEILGLGEVWAALGAYQGVFVVPLDLRIGGLERRIGGKEATVRPLHALRPEASADSFREAFYRLQKHIFCLNKFFSVSRMHSSTSQSFLRF